MVDVLLHLLCQTQSVYDLLVLVKIGSSDGLQRCCRLGLIVVDVILSASSQLHFLVN